MSIQLIQQHRFQFQLLVYRYTKPGNVWFHSTNLLVRDCTDPAVPIEIVGINRLGPILPFTGPH